MADTEPELTPVANEEEIETPGYKPPAQKSLDEIKNLDADDPSLVTYKLKLLGEAATAAASSDGPNVIVEKMMFEPEGRKPIELDLTADLTKFKETPFTIKEGVEYKIRIIFKVQREIVSGLKLFQVTYRKGIAVDKSAVMVGSYGPKAESHNFLTPKDEAPKGMVSRGSYKVKSKFVDDDKNVYLAWEWAFHIRKDWD